MTTEKPEIPEDPVLRFLRDRGVKPNEFVRITGVKAPEASLVLSGNRGIAYKHLAKIAAYFQVPTADLFRKESDRSPSPNVARTEDEDALLAFFRQADVRAQSTILDLAKNWAQRFPRSRAPRKLREDPPDETPLNGTES